MRGDTNNFRHNTIHPFWYAMNAHTILRFELSRLPELDSTKLALASSHITGEIDLRKSGTPLTPPEKKALGITSRAKITRDLINLFMCDALAIGDAINKIDCARLDYANKLSLLALLQEYQTDRSIKLCEFVATNDDRTCSWCKATDGKKFRPEPSFLELINSNCQCMYFRASVST